MPTVRPYTTLRIAANDEPTLEPEAGTLPDKALLRSGSVSLDLTVEDGAVKLPAMQAPDLVSVEWQLDGSTLFESGIEVVSRHYFEIDALKAMDETDDFSGVPEDGFWEARQAAEETFERNAQRSFVERLGSTETHSGGFVWLDHCDVTEIETEGWELRSDSTAAGPRGHAVIEYRYGLSQIPLRVSEAVMQLAAYYLRPEATPSRATGEATEAGFLRYTLAGKDGATGLPEIDAVIDQFGRGRVVVL